MDAPTFVERIEAKLAGHPEAKVEKDENRLWVLPADDTGFTVLIFAEGDRFAVYFNGWHEEFEEEDGAVACFLTGLTDACRIIEERRGGETYKWILESRAEDGWWTHSTTSLPLAPFWKRKKAVTLQNRLLKPREAEIGVSRNTDTAAP